MPKEETNEENTVVDETVNFEITSNEEPNAEADPQEESSEEESTSSDENETDGAETKQDSETEDAGTEDAANPKKKIHGVQKRTSKLVRQREEARRERDAAKAELAELKAKKTEKKTESKTDEPKENDFDTYDEYLDALDEHEKGSKEPSKKEEKTEKEEDKSGLTDSQKTAQAVIQDYVANAEDLPKDFNEVALADEVPVTPNMMEEISNCDDPTKVMYALGKDINLAKEIAGKSPAQQMREIVKLDLAVVDKTPPKPKNKTNAPDPISPVRGSDAQEKAEADMSYSEFEAKRNADEQKGSGGW